MRCPKRFGLQKRLVLNRCFKLVQEHASAFGKLTYVTFGGEDLYDVMDLLCVFDVSSLELRIVSYEMDEAVAKNAQRCPVTKTLTRSKRCRSRSWRSTFRQGSNDTTDQDRRIRSCTSSTTRRPSATANAKRWRSY